MRQCPFVSSQYSVSKLFSTHGSLLWSVLISIRYNTSGGTFANGHASDIESITVLKDAQGEKAHHPILGGL
ncbi:MAG: hypothetical protein H8E97_08080 [Bacteroidetes bacterium]|nr:hypothetical protein [Bacteroidota bacterium]